MDKLKRTATLVASAAVAILLIVWLVGAFGIRAPLFAFLANWVAMSWVAFSGQFIRIPLPPEYYAPHRFERGGRIYELMGIRLFKKLVRRGPLAVFSPTLRFPREKVAEALLALASEMCKAESGHVLILAIILVAAAYFALRTWFDAAAWLLLFSIPINVYPIMLQRYNRIKLQELIDGLGQPALPGEPARG